MPDFMISSRPPVSRRFFCWKTRIGEAFYQIGCSANHTARSGYPASSARGLPVKSIEESMPLEESLNTRGVHGVHGEGGCHGRLYPPTSGFLQPCNFPNVSLDVRCHILSLPDQAIK